jgi:hypothetical protein
MICSNMFDKLTKIKTTLVHVDATWLGIRLVP